MSDHYVITIARGFGSGGKTIGINLSEELGIPCYEDQLLRMASDYSGISEQLFAQVDEKLRGSYIKKKLAGLHSRQIRNLFRMIIFSIFRRRLSVSWPIRSHVLSWANAVIWL